MTSPHDTEARAQGRTRRGTRGKRAAGWSAALAVLVVLAAGVAGRNWLEEEWYLHKLSIGDHDDRVFAAKRLSQMRSVRAVPALLDEIARATFKKPEEETLWLHGSDIFLVEALGRIGRPAIPLLLEAFNDTDPSRQVAGMFGLGWLAEYNADLGEVPKMFENLLQDPSQPESLRRSAGVALESIRKSESAQPEAEAQE